MREIGPNVILSLVVIDTKDVKVVRSHRKTMTLNVLSDGTIQVKAPFLMPKFLINDFIRKHMDWIEEKVRGAKRNVRSGKFSENDKFLYLGKEYLLNFGNYSKIEIKDGKLLFPIGLRFRAKKEIESWYIRQAKELIKEQTAYYASVMNTSFKSISFSDTKSKWGSCTHDNRLQFNWRLIMAPLLVLRYVVIHELAHTIEKNHSHSFWARVGAQNPSYKQQIKWLKFNGDSLVI